MKAFKYIFFLLLIAIIGISIYIAVQPNHFSFSRSKIIQAPASLLYNKVNDLKHWPNFSPWIEQEPDALLSYGEKTSGVDANYAWSGNILGEGNMKTTAIEENKSITQHITFIKPFESQSNINWLFETTKAGTKVTWTMDGKQDFMTKLFTTFKGSIEKNTAPHFNRGLFKLDSIVTTDMKKHSINVDGITEYGGGFYMYKTTSVNGVSNISDIMSKQYADIANYMAKNDITATGMPFTIYNEMNTEDGSIIMSNAIPVMNKINLTNKTPSEILCGYIPKTKVLKTTLKGNYTYLKKAWNIATEHVIKNNLIESTIKPFEIYTNDPHNIPNPADWKTEIYIPIQEE